MYPMTWSHQILCLKTFNLGDLGYGLDPVYSLSVYLNIQQSVQVFLKLPQKKVFYIGI